MFLFLNQNEPYIYYKLTAINNTRAALGTDSICFFIHSLIVQKEHKWLFSSSLQDAIIVP